MRPYRRGGGSRVITGCNAFDMKSERVAQLWFAHTVTPTIEHVFEPPRTEVEHMKDLENRYSDAALASGRIMELGS